MTNVGLVTTVAINAGYYLFCYRSLLPITHTHKMMRWFFVSSSLSEFETRLTPLHGLIFLRDMAWRTSLTVREKSESRSFSTTTRFHCTVCSILAVMFYYHGARSDLCSLSHFVVLKNKHFWTNQIPVTLATHVL